MSADQHTAFQGLCLAIVQSARNQPGPLRVKVSADGLSGAETEISVTPEQ